MSNDKYCNYLEDLGFLIKEDARKAIQEHIKSKGTDGEDFQSGYMMGFHRVITLMQQQANAFNIPLKEIRLDDISENEFFNQ